MIPSSFEAASSFPSSFKTIFRTKIYFFRRMKFNFLLSIDLHSTYLFKRDLLSEKNRSFHSSFPSLCSTHDSNSEGKTQSNVETYFSSIKRISSASSESSHLAQYMFDTTSRTFRDKNSSLPSLFSISNLH